MAKKTVKKSTRRRGNVVPLTSRYLYVEARGWFRELIGSTTDDDVRVLDGPISFDSIQVDARSEEDAFSLGVAQLQQRQDEETERDEDGDFIDGTHASADFLNDYVVKL